MTASTNPGPDFVNELAEDFIQRFRRGEHPSVSEYVQDYPEVADQVADVIQVLLLMEKLGAEQGLAEVELPEHAPERLGEYRIVQEIGRGGMGIVYEAVQDELCRHVALKVLPSSILRKETHLLRFRREAQAAARLHHSNIVPVFGVGSHEGTHFYAMQYIQGQSVDIVLKNVRQERESRVTGSSQTAVHTQHSSTLSGTSSASVYAQNVAQIGVQIADALEHAHKAGVLHRDVKPSNILLDTEGRAWLSDFGLSQCADVEELTETGEIVGTFRYMAAERFKRQADARSDIYALGLTLYELLTLQPAFAELDRPKLIHQIMKQDPIQPRRIDANIPRDLETIILKAIAKEPGHRYQRAEELAADLSRFLTDRPVSARRLRWWERSWRWARRNVAVSLTGLSALIALTTGLALTYWQWQRAEDNALSEHHASIRANQLREQAETNAKLAWDAFGRMIQAVNNSMKLPAEEMKRDILQQALNLHKEYLGRVNDPPRRFEAARIAATLSLMWQRTNAYDIAERQARTAIEAYEELLALGYQEPETRLGLAHSLATCAGLLQRRQQLKEADEYAARGVEIVRPLFDAKPGDWNARYRLGWCLFTRAAICRQLETSWEELARESIEHARTLCGEVRPAVLAMEAQAEFRRIYAEWLMKDQRYDEARDQIQEAVKVCDRVANDFPMLPSTQDNLRLCLELLGDVHLRRQDYDQAAGAYRRVVLQQRVRFEKNPSDPLLNRALAYALFTLATALREERKIQEALPLVEEAIQRERTALALRPDDVKSQRMLRNYQMLTASLFLHKGDAARSAELAAKVTSLPRVELQDYWDVAYHLCECAQAALKDGRRSEEERRALAKSCHDRAVEQLREGVRRGFRDRKQMQKAAFDHLRNREDFRQVLSDMEKPVSPKKSENP